MSDEENSDSPIPLRDWKEDLPTWRRIGGFIRNILRLERTVGYLSKENDRLEQRILALQRQVDEQTGQLKVVLKFIDTALDEHVEIRAEKAAIRAFEQMASVGRLKSNPRTRRKK